MRRCLLYSIPILLLLASCINDGDEANFVGPDLCELSEACNDRGSCDATSGEVVCSCDTGFTGDHCLRCDVGYHPSSDGGCLIDEDCSTNDPCDNGTCSTTAGVIACECDAGWAGDTCNACAAGWHNEDGACALDQQCIETTCSGSLAEESCDDLSGVISCVCNSEYTGTFCESCNGSHHRDATGACVADDVCVVVDPCVNGTCGDTGGVYSCACDLGWAGEFCDTCALGFHDQAGECVLIECFSDSDCDNSFFCTGAVTCDGNNLCVANAPITCSGNGLCNETSDSCDCTGGFTGADCSIPPPPVVSNLSVTCPGDPFCANTATPFYSESFDVTGVVTSCTISFTPNDFGTGLGTFVLDPQVVTQTFTWAPGTVSRTVTVSVQCSNATGDSNTVSVTAFVVDVL